MVKGYRLMINMELVDRLKEFMEIEARSCSMDFGCITPLYVYRMWGGTASLNEIEEAWFLDEPSDRVERMVND